MDESTEKLVLAAIAAAADVMDAIDPDDRSISQIVLVDEVKVWMVLANAGDMEKRRLLWKAVPSWGPTVARQQSYPQTRYVVTHVGGVPLDPPVAFEAPQFATTEELERAAVDALVQR